MYKTLVRFGFHPCSFNICFLTELFVVILRPEPWELDPKRTRVFLLEKKTFLSVLAMETLFYRI